MSGGRKQRGKKESAVAMPTVTVPVSALVGGWGGVSGYQGAGYSRNRGYIYWPTLDPTREMPSQTRVELARRIHFLKANVGLPRRICSALTNLIVGAGLWPQALTNDREWNSVATKYYYNRAQSPITFDVTSKFAAGEFQRQAVETRLGDGDSAVVYTYSESGRLMRKLYSGLQIGNSSDQGIDQARWTDGVRLDALERPAVYRFLTQAGKRSRDIESAKMTFLAKYPKPGSVRGESILSHAVNKLIDITEMHASWVNVIKNSSTIGYYIAAANAAGGMNSMPAEVMKQLQRGQQKEATTADGKKITLKVVMGNGDELVELPPGYDIKTLLDERPHPNQAEFLDEIVRDVCWGTGLSFDLLWKIYKLGGANTRYMLADAQVFAEAEQDRLIFGWLMRDYAQTIAAGMVAGDVPECPDPEWWAHGWLPPARMTVDFGRDGRIMLEEYERGLITTERYFALKGQDAKEEFVTECDFAEFRRAEMERRGLTEADFRYMRRGGGAAAEERSEDPEDEEKKRGANEEEVAA
jgi:capsid protein